LGTETTPLEIVLGFHQLNIGYHLTIAADMTVGETENISNWDFLANASQAVLFLFNSIFGAYTLPPLISSHLKL
jgi:hypothetical protein